MIILTASQAIQVSGETQTGNELRPVPLADGVTFVLPVEVLTDPAHAEHHAFLSTLPVRDILPEEWPQPSTGD
jgi:hypothetical protein